MIKALLIILGGLLCLVVLWILALRGRRNRPGLKALLPYRYAHRGLHDAQRPENSLAAFQAALDKGYGMELDVHLLRGGGLAVIHDASLKRTTGQEGKIEELSEQELSHYTLENTAQTIPTLRQVLDLVDGQVPLIIEIKTDGKNYHRVTERVCQELEGYQGLFCLESFDPRSIQWLRRHRPQLIRGQLAENSLRRDSPLPWILRFLITNHLGNFLSVPDFVAYRYEDRNDFSTFLVRRIWGVQGVSWTIRSEEELRLAEADGWLPIFENFTP